ncbi:MAG: TetR family transcriptional regulator [Mycolicibacterium sp.]|nr:MAG: TetR family transcriptional regulator [Mycolicibacterium sp.]
MRERKKLRTRQAIQLAALELVGRNGFAETSVEQIAEAAEVSPATFFRYFPTKASTLISDALDRLAVSTLAAQPKDVSTMEAFRRAVVAAQATLVDPEWEFERRRRRLVFSIPGLRELQFEEHRRTPAKMARAEARRLGQPQDELEMRAFFAALFDAGLAVLGSSPDLPDEMFDVIEFIETGLPLQSSDPQP